MMSEQVTKKVLGEPGEFISTSRQDGEIVDYLNTLFQSSAREGYSDIHIEDTDDGAVVRRRLNGRMREYGRLPRKVSDDIQDKIRKKSKIPTNERRRPNDGRMYVEVDGRAVDIRVNIYPIRTGHSLVCRLLDQENARRQLDSIEMLSSVKDELHRILQLPEGMLVVSGPTGSGKTSTLYAALNKLNTPDKKIVTAEDPVEYRLDGLAQGEITNDMTFAGALRAIVRQDPDIVLVGEIRDAETASVATEMALTGHLVLSTIHANSSAATVTRMLQLGVHSFNLGAALRGVLAQRLARKLCEKCAVERAPTDYERRWMESYDIAQVSLPVFDANPQGCEFCSHGHNGRTPVLELMAVTQEIAELINDKRPAAEVELACAQQHQFETLAQSAMRLCHEGRISFKEVIRIGGTGKVVN